MSEKGQDEITADYEAQQIGTHIAHKIYELNNPPNRNKTQHKKIVAAQVTNNFENTGRDDPKDNNVPNNDNSSAFSSHSITEVNNNASEEHRPLSKTSLSDDKDNEHENVTFSDKENDERKESELSSTTHISGTSQNSTDNTELD